MANKVKLSKTEHDASVSMLAAVIASGGQIIVSRESMQQVANHRLAVHTTAWGETVFTAISRSRHNQCGLCDGLGGYAIVGSTGPGQVCPGCNGSGVKLSST